MSCKLIQIHRDGIAVSVTVDGVPIPAQWIDRVSCDVAVDDHRSTVTLTLSTDRLVTDAGGYRAFVREAEHGQAQIQTAAEAAQQRVRLPEPTCLSHS